MTNILDTTTPQNTRGTSNDNALSKLMADVQSSEVGSQEPVIDKTYVNGGIDLTEEIDNVDDTKINLSNTESSETSEPVPEGTVVSPQKPGPRVLKKIEQTFSEVDTVKVLSDDDRSYMSDLVVNGVLGGARDAIAEGAIAGMELFNFLFQGDKDINERAVIDRLIPTIDDPDSFSATLTRGMSQYLTGFTIAFKGLKAAGIGVAGGGTALSSRVMMSSMLSSSFAFNPHAERLSNLISDHVPLARPVSDFLAAEEDDSSALGRFKAGIEDVVLNKAIGNAFMASVKLIKGAKKAGSVSEKAMLEKGVIESIEPSKPFYGDKKTPLLSTSEKGGTTDSLNSIKVSAGKKIFDINPTKLNNEKDLDKVYKQISAVFSNAKGKSFSDVDSLAKTLGVTGERLLERRKGQPFEKGEVQAANSMLKGSLVSLKDISKSMRASGEISDTMYGKLRRALDVHSAIGYQALGVKSDAGKALRAARIESETLKHQLETLDVMLKGSNSRKSLDNIAVYLTEGIDDGAINGAIRRRKESGFFDAPTELFLGNILSGPSTHVMNIESNTSMLSLSLLERVTAGGIDVAQSRITGSPRAIFASEVLAQVKSIPQGAVDGAKMAKEAFLSGGLNDPLTKVALPDKSAISSASIKWIEEGSTAASMVNFYGKFVRTPSFVALASEDAMFKGLNRGMELRALAHRKAKLEGLTGKDFADRVDGLVKDPPIHEYDAAARRANVNTFTTPNKVAKPITTLTNEVTALKFLAPFVNTITNVIDQGIQRTPFSFLLPPTQEALAKGGADRAEALARITVGTSMSSYFAKLAMDGDVTGPEHHNKSVEAARRATDPEYRPNSIRFKREDGSSFYWDYSRIEPLNMIFSMGAAYGNIAMSLEKDSDRDDIGQMISSNIAELIVDNVWLGQLTDVISNIESKEGPDKKIKNIVSSMIVPNWITQSSKVLFDTTKKNTETILQEVQNRLGGFSEVLGIAGGREDLPDQRNIWGEAIEYRSVIKGLENEGYLALLPGAYKLGRDTDDINTWIFERQMQTGNPIVSRPSKRINPGANAEPVEMTPEQYDIFTEVSGKKAREIVEGEWSNRSIYNDAQFEILVRSAISVGKLIGRATILEQFPNIASQMEDNIINRMEDLHSIDPVTD